MFFAFCLLVFMQPGTADISLDLGTVQKVAERAGYSVLHMETVISEIPIMQNFLSYEDPYLGAAAHNGKVLGLIDEEMLHKNLLGYKMQAVMRPR